MKSEWFICTIACQLGHESCALNITPEWRSGSLKASTTVGFEGDLRQIIAVTFYIDLPMYLPGVRSFVGVNSNGKRLLLEERVCWPKGGNVSPTLILEFCEMEWSSRQLSHNVYRSL